MTEQGFYQSHVHLVQISNLPKSGKYA